jgi:hypothetical protein
VKLYNDTSVDSADLTWGADLLSATIDKAHANARRTFAIEPERCAALIEVDALYRSVLGHLDGNPEQLASAFLLKTHSLNTGAVSLALSGLVAEAYSLLNRTLKTAMQGVFVAADSQRQQLWINRHDSDDARALMQAEFSTQNLHRHLRKIDASTLTICETLLRRTRDHSNHPNAYAATTPKPPVEAGFRTTTQNYFVDDGEVLRYCLRSAAQVGICCLCVFFYVFPDEYRNAGVPDRLTKLRRGH